MNHARHVIREALVAALAAGGTSAGARVYDNPSDVRQAWPAIVVEDMGESQTPLTLEAGAAGILERRCEIEVAVELQQTTGYARARDQLLADVERIAITATLGAKWIVPVSYAPDLSNAGERPIVIGRQRFEFGYYTTQGDPATTV